MSRLPITLAVVFLSLATVIHIGAKLGDDSSKATIDVEKYAGMPRSKLIEAMNSFADSQYRPQNNLITLLLRPHLNKQVSIAAIYMLGSYHSERAVPVLADMIDFEDDAHELYDHFPVWGRYPAYDALIKIGVPSTSALINNLETSDVPKVKELSRNALSSIYCNARCAQVLLEQEIARKSLSMDKKLRLQQALGIMSNSTPDTLPMNKDEQIPQTQPVVAGH